jgi:acetoin utilization deacetylase AcuC-like enzyme
MALLFATHGRYLDHVASPRHPERPERLAAVLRGAHDAAVADALVPLDPRAATREELERVHPPAYLAAVERFCADGGGFVDADTGANPASWDASVLASGAVISAVEAVERGDGEAAFCAVRPPGHHATPDQAMGFCFLNHVAVAAAALAARGERVLIVDYDAHHGNGTQDIFYDDPRVLYVSLHQSPLYPGTGRLDEQGFGLGQGTTCNLPLPPHSTGDVYLQAIERVVEPLARGFGPTWMLLSAGFDAHRLDPLTDLGLSAGDFAVITKRLLELAPMGRTVAVLEGGYDLDALQWSTAATMAALLGVDHHPESPTGGGPGDHVIRAAERLWAEIPMA